MKQEKLLKQKIGMRLSRAGLLSKVFAVQTFMKENLDITPEQYTVLTAIKDNNGIYQRQLANLTLKDRPNINRIVSILEEAGYLTSEIASDGRQVKKLYITEKGLNICDKTLPVVLENWKTIAGGIEETELDNFIKTLDKIETNLREKAFLQI